MDMPHTTIGILGSGQLGRMLVIAAAQLGIKTHIFAPDAKHSPAGEIAHAVTTAAYDDYAALHQFAARVDVITSEFENVPSDTMAHLAQFCPVSPGTTVTGRWVCPGGVSRSRGRRAPGRRCCLRY